jgi:hypothetical protein
MRRRKRPRTVDPPRKTAASVLAFLKDILTTHLAAPPEAKNHQAIMMI